MITAAFGALLGSVATAFLIGYAFVAPRGAFFTTKRGVWLLVILGISFVPLPPQIAAIDTGALPLADVLGPGGASAFAWPEGFGKTAYLVTWAVATVLAFLVGIRIWQAGSPEWRGGGSGVRLYDASAVSRVSSLLPMADSLEDALDTIGRAHLAPRDAPNVAADVRKVGKQFSDELPQKAGDVYALVAEKMPGEVASLITGYLLEGAGRRASR